MFWRFGFHAPSAIDGLVSKEGVELEQVLNSPDILQETKGENRNLIDFLIKPWNFTKLLDHVTQLPPPKDNEKDRFKYANLSCEILTADVVTINNGICSAEHFDRIWGMLNAPPPMHPLLGSFFLRIVNAIMKTRPQVILSTIQDDPSQFDKLLTQIGNSAIMDVVMNIATTTATFGLGMKSLQEWLVQEQNFLPKLLTVFGDASQNSDVVQNTAQIMVDIVNHARKQPQEHKPLELYLNAMLSEDFVTKLLENSLKGPKVSIESGLSVVLTLVNERPRAEEEAPPTKEEIEAHRVAIQGVLAAIRKNLSNLHNLLVSPPTDGRTLVTAAGPLGAPLGSLRVKLARLLEAVAAIGDAEIDQQLASLSTPKILLEFFFKYPDNNLFQRHVVDLINNAISRAKAGDSKNILLESILKDATLQQRTVKAWLESLADEAQPKKHRHGYMGFLINVANTLETLRGTPQDVFAMYLPELQGSEEQKSWDTFVNDQLKVVNDLLKTIPGGERPPETQSANDDDFGTIVNAEETTNAELAFARFLEEKITGDIPDELVFDDEAEDGDLISQYGTDGPFAPSIVYNTDSPAAAPEQDWQILDGPEGSDGPMPDAEWNEKKTIDENVVVKPRVTEADSNSDNDESADDDDSFGSYTVNPKADVPLSPRSAQAVASMPTVDPFTSPRKSSGAAASSEGGWAAFDSPQAMDVQPAMSDSEYQRKLDLDLIEADFEIKREKHQAFQDKEAKEAKAQQQKMTPRKLPKTPNEVTDSMLLTADQEEMDEGKRRSSSNA